MLILQCTAREIYVLYGSQTGNSEFIASTMAQSKIASLGIRVNCFPLNLAKGVDFKTKAVVVIIG